MASWLKEGKRKDQRSTSFFDAERDEEDIRMLLRDLSPLGDGSS